MENGCMYLIVFIALYFIFFTYSELYTSNPEKQLKNKKLMYK